MNAKKALSGFREGFSFALESGTARKQNQKRKKNTPHSPKE